jgi:hypothetical protein
MTRLICICAAAILLAASPAMALKGDRLKAAADLAEKTPNTYSGGYFDGYVQGLVEGKAQDEELCIPDGVVQGQVAEAVRKYLKDHPEELHLHAVPLILKAIQAAWPCK